VTVDAEKATNNNKAQKSDFMLDIASRWSGDIDTDDVRECGAKSIPGIKRADFVVARAAHGQPLVKSVNRSLPCRRRGSSNGAFTDDPKLFTVAGPKDNKKIDARIGAYPFKSHMLSVCVRTCKINRRSK
jgi:hypothetical protein